MRLFKGLSRTLQGIIFPPACVGCGRQTLVERSFCMACLETATRLRVQEIPLPAGLASLRVGPTVSQGSRQLAHGLKYQGLRRDARELVRLAQEVGTRESWPSNARLVPVPLHPTRRRERGYNQSELLAREWSRHLGLEVATNFLVRTRSTGTQTRLDAEERRANLASAFKAGRDFKPGVPVILIDDVLTTGSTLSACAAALLEAGSGEVHGLVCLWAGEA